MKDVESIFLCQMGYLNWDKLSPELIKENRIKNSIPAIIDSPILWKLLKNSWYQGKKQVQKYDEYDLRFILKYTSTKNSTPLFNFEDWEFIYSGKYQDIFFKITGVEGIKPNSNICDFRGTIFRKEKEVVLVLSGINYQNILFKNNLTLDEFTKYRGFSHEKIGAYLLYKLYLRDYRQERDILYFTGHSFGGGLAQYLSIITEGKYSTVTWNPIGMESFLDTPYFEKDVDVFPRKVKGFYELNSSAIEKLNQLYFNKEKIIDSTILNSNAESDIFNILSKEKYRYYSEIEENTNKVDFPYVTIIDTHSSKIKHKALSPAHKFSIYYHLLISYLFHMNRNKVLKIKNYVTTEEWSNLIEKKLGSYINVMNFKESYSHRDNKNILRHNIGDFFLFLDNSGNISPFQMRKEILMGALNTILSIESGPLIKHQFNHYVIKRKNFDNFNISKYILNIIQTNKGIFNEKNIKYIELLTKELTLKSFNFNHSFTLERDKNGSYISIGSETSLNKICGFSCAYKRKIYIK